MVLDNNLKTQKTINVNREDSSGRLILKKDKETGLEGIAIDQRGEVYLANQSFNRLPDSDPSVIIQIDPLSSELKEVIDETYDSVIIYKFRLPAEGREILGVEPPSSEDIFF